MISEFSFAALCSITKAGARRPVLFLDAICSVPAMKKKPGGEISEKAISVAPFIASEASDKKTQAKRAIKKRQHPHIASEAIAEITHAVNNRLPLPRLFRHSEIHA